MKTTALFAASLCGARGLALASKSCWTALVPSLVSASRVRTLTCKASDDRLSELRAAMAEAGVDAFVVPSGDPHLSEYVHPRYERRAFLSGFTGSAGVALVTQEDALLWTDGRYFLQAEDQLGPDWTLMRSL